MLPHSLTNFSTDVSLKKANCFKNSAGSSIERAHLSILERSYNHIASKPLIPVTLHCRKWMLHCPVQREPCPLHHHAAEEYLNPAFNLFSHNFNAAHSGGWFTTWRNACNTVLLWHRRRGLPGAFQNVLTLRNKNSSFSVGDNPDNAVHNGVAKQSTTKKVRS